VSEHAGAVLEHAVLHVAPAQQDAFERAFDRAKAIIAASPGFRSLRLGRCVEHDDRYVLLVEWETLEDHTEGFRGSSRYEEWRALLHHFYDPFPEVTHFAEVFAVGR